MIFHPRRIPGSEPWGNNVYRYNANGQLELWLWKGYWAACLTNDFDKVADRFCDAKLVSYSSTWCEPTLEAMRNE